MESRLCPLGLRPLLLSNTDCNYFLHLRNLGAQDLVFLAAIILTTREVIQQATRYFNLRSRQIVFSKDKHGGK